MSRAIGVNPSNGGPPRTNFITATANQPNRTVRRGQIMEQMEEQLNRQMGPKKRRVINLVTEEGPAKSQDWVEVRVSEAPGDLIARNGYERRQGWKRGRDDDDWFAKFYRNDGDEIPYFKGRYKTPQNSNVSNDLLWQSAQWYGEAPKRPRISKCEEPLNAMAIQALREARNAAVKEQRFFTSANSMLGENWKGVKILGEGGQGVIGLWEYTGADTPSWGRKIVIKKSLSQPLNEERDMMMKMGHGDSGVTHVVRLLYPIVGNRTNLFSIVLEFCEGGDLHSLILEHRKKKEPLSEENLWLFFECFARGLNIMDHGTESPERKPDSRDPICHFDIKPMNILRGGLDSEHSLFPICKIADFGLATSIHPTNYQKVWRRRGTQGFYPPEQFSSRWAYNDADRGGHVNVWGTHTNMWQIGVVMYTLATLGAPPRPRGFRASAIGKKFTYGPKLQDLKYSNALKSLIWKCLCDKPKQRPDLKTLEEEISIAIGVLKRRRAGSPQQLDPPEPTGPSQGPPPDVGTGGQAAATAAATGAATGTRIAPYIVPGETVRIFRGVHFMFSVVPKYLATGKQEPIWFQARPDSTVKGLKQTIRGDAGLNLADAKQFLYLRLPEATVLLNREARMLSSYGVGQGTRLELWDDPKAHDENEPDEPGFDVL